MLSQIAPKSECQRDDQCRNDQTCINGFCKNVCSKEFNPCAETASCVAQNHRASCECNKGLVGDPFTNCFRQPSTDVGCRDDSECAPDHACINKKCQNPCFVEPCRGSNAECQVQYHRAVCTCPHAWAGDPHTRCYKRKNIFLKFNVMKK